MTSSPLVLGINCAYHESAAAIMRGSETVFAVEEERLTRIKHGKPARIDNPDELPWRAIEACLKAAGAQLGSLDAIAYSLAPGRRAVGCDPYPVDEAAGWGTPRGEDEFDRRVRAVPQQFPGTRFEFVPHHLAHAANAWFSSPFQRAALLVVDGIGENSTGWLGQADPGIQPLQEIAYPNSLGFLWERIAAYLGFSTYDAPKVMGLAAYGNASSRRAPMQRLLQVHPEGFQVDAGLAAFRAADFAGLESLFGPARQAHQDPTEARFADVAAALQEQTEEALLALARHLHALTGQSHLAYGGGVALNCVANGRLEREGPFREIYIPPAAHDAGTALGAAQWVASQITASSPRSRPDSPFPGPQCTPDELRGAIQAAGLAFREVVCPATEAAQRLARGELVGWFQGGLELGPRALGHRSLLAHPGSADMREHLNHRIKHREPFRPFAAAILAERVEEWFEVPARPGPARDLMLFAYKGRQDNAARIPAVMHRDGTCRIQAVHSWRDPLFHRLLQRFETLTGLPLLLNTSFNDSEPIVCSPEDALSTYQRTGLDALLLGHFLLEKQPA